MAVGNRLFLLLLLLSQQVLLLQSFKILTLAFIGGSHYLIMDEISTTLHKRGHEVQMLLQDGVMLIPGLQCERPDSYRITTWSATKEYISEFKKWFDEFKNDFTKGSETFQSYLDFMSHLAFQCHVLLNDSETLNSLKDRKFDIAVIDAFNPCSFLAAEKLGLPFVAVFPGTLANAAQAGIPSPLSYVPVFHSRLTDRMDFWGRLKNCLMAVSSPVLDYQVHARFKDVISKHFPASSRPDLSELYLKAELWIYNTDFSIEFARPLLPNTVFMGGFLAKPAKPLPEELEDFIERTEEAGFVIVTLGSMVSSIPHLELLKELNAGFAQLPQGVLWRYQVSRWPKEIEKASNVKIVDWLPQNDLLGHPKARLLVTHGGLNSLMEAIYHGVPVVGMSLFGDQHDNMVRVEAKTLGLSLCIDQLTAHRFAQTMKKVIGDQRYKSAAVHLSTIHRSHPFPPQQRLAGWIEHILQVGSGAHLKPYAFYQPWHQHYLLDVWLFLFTSFLSVSYLCLRFVGSVVKRIHSFRKQKLM